MLAKILEDMWVEPEVLEALSEDQKRILFLKMREEQVRRWREREEKEERDGGRAKHVKTKTVYRKHVTWLLGRDGDVSVSVIGELDEFRSCKILQSLMNRVRADDVRGVQTEEPLPEGEARKLHFTRDIQLSLTDVSDEATSPDEDADDCSADDDDPKDPSEDSGGGSSESDCSSLDERDSIPLYRPHLSDHGNRPRPNAQQPHAAEESGQKDREIVRLKDKRCERGGRVAELRKAFADNPVPADSTETPSPGRAAHSHRGRAPLVH
ncbi:uncharacterized protein LOC142899712 [Nelusetta ayraudi]|uniref:uncharacterized protein LOC142899712 n=1 Tax=Nelusetta ayraudi TaxID=303726 RepID=UPI003F6FBFA0